MKSPVHFWKKRKTDEMEDFYLYKSQRNAYFFLMLSLAIWSLVEGFEGLKGSRSFNPFPAILLGGASLIQLFSKWIFERNAVKDDEDSFETGPFRKLAFAVFFIVLAVLFGGYFFFYMMVRV